MKVSGSALVHAPRERVWQALTDPAVLVRTIPGCQTLEEVGQDAYRMTLTAGVASIKGTYRGDVQLRDQRQPASFLMKASGAGGPGTVSAEVVVRLADESDGVTRLDYDADAVVGGMIGGVGQRVLAGVAKKTAGEFFQAVDDALNGKIDAVVPAAPAETSASVAADQPADAAGGVFHRPAAGRPPLPGGDFLAGAVFGALATLAGALVGGWLAGRRAGRR